MLNKKPHELFPQPIIFVASKVICWACHSGLGLGLSCEKMIGLDFEKNENPVTLSFISNHRFK
jgi:hypothetical protein